MSAAKGSAEPRCPAQEQHAGGADRPRARDPRRGAQPTPILEPSRKPGARPASGPADRDACAASRPDLGIRVAEQLVQLVDGLGTPELPRSRAARARARGSSSDTRRNASGSRRGSLIDAATSRSGTAAAPWAEESSSATARSGIGPEPDQRILGRMAGETVTVAEQTNERCELGRGRITCQAHSAAWARTSGCRSCQQCRSEVTGLVEERRAGVCPSSRRHQNRLCDQIGLRDPRCRDPERAG